MTQDQVTRAEFQSFEERLWSRFESTVGPLKEENQSIKEENRSIKEENRSIKEEVGTLKEEVGTLKEEVGTLKEELHEMKCHTTVREVTIRLDTLLTTQLCDTHSVNPTTDCLYKFADKENRRPHGTKLKNKTGSTHSCLPLQAIPALAQEIRSLKHEGNKQNHTIYQDCVGESVAMIQAQMESGVNGSGINRHFKKVANNVVRQALDAVLLASTPTSNKRHPPASPLVSTSPTKKLKEVQQDNVWQIVSRPK
jgi:regulator of replication initiation timing